MSKPTLLILAAGMASRYGSMKQVDGFGPNGETIIDYSIYDAIHAGFGKITFVIREEFADDFKNIFEPKLNGKIATDYVYQSMDLKPYGLDFDVTREKPWGTAHAVLAAREKINEPFCVINADDFYGYEAYKKMYNFLTTEASAINFCLVGYQLDKTLSDHGSVSRGVCTVNSSGLLQNINECTKLYWKDKNIVYEENSSEKQLAPNTLVSMNFWGFTPAVFDISEKMFIDFAKANKENPTSEFFIPFVVEQLVTSQQASFKVIPTDTQWFGVTYNEDKPLVQQSISALVNSGVYPQKLWD